MCKDRKYNSIALRVKQTRTLFDEIVVVARFTGFKCSVFYAGRDDFKERGAVKCSCKSVFMQYYANAGFSFPAIAWNAHCNPLIITYRWGCRDV